MNKLNDGNILTTKNNEYNLNQSNNKYDYEVMLKVQKFHYSTINPTIQNVHNECLNHDVNKWIETFTLKDILPNSYLQKIELKKYNKVKKNSGQAFTKESIKDEELTEILYDAFARDKNSLSKNYPSAGALYPVIPLLLVTHSTNESSILSPGCYVYDSMDQNLLKIEEWDEIEVLEKVKSYMSTDHSDLPIYCMAYAIDFRRAITKYENKGYRHAMIETGLAAQSFKNSLSKYSTIKERCWSGFQDLPLSKYCGMDIRLTPITLLQWFGYENVEIEVHNDK
ncbi:MULTISPECIES: nitroreductase family protein [unclassified Exiguobacterium]|uniref:nitroreductase family protein n=1 Tax=unclassified Exiguobacterium TaxID=2644629 RepID=UPI001BEB91AC|nr:MULTISPECIES: nitroreductase family protein [unclassified Exiguobacterium]